MNFFTSKPQISDEPVDISQSSIEQLISILFLAIANYNNEPIDS